jgi:HEAT repeat protein
MSRSLLALGLSASLAWGGSQASEKNMARRAEAQDIVDQLLRGEGNVNALTARAAFIGQEAIVALDLSDMARRGDENQQRTIAQALSNLAHPNGEPALLYLIGSDDGPTRMYSAIGLGKMKSAAAFSRLMPLLQDKSMGVRKEAARALGNLHNPRSGAALAKAAKAEGEIDARAVMLIAVGQSGDKKQIAALETFLDDSSESARFSAAQALCALGGKKGLDFAKKLLASNDRYERMQGVQLFEGARAKEVNAVLAPLLDDKDRSVAAAAARILYQGGDGAKLDWLVLHSFQANGDEKLAYEKELETLRLADDQRRAILARAGIK